MHRIANNACDQEYYVKKGHDKKCQPPDCFHQFQRVNLAPFTVLSPAEQAARNQEHQYNQVKPEASTKYRIIHRSDDNH